MNIPTPLFRRAPLAAALALSIAFGGTASTALEQDGTGAATPTPPTACELVSATYTGATDDDITPMASPELAASPAAGESTIPVTFLGATPETGASVSDVLARDLQAAATAIAGCLSDGQYETLVKITGDTYRGQLVGAGFPLTASEFTIVAEAMPDVPYQILRVENATLVSDTTATAEVTYELAHQVRYSTWEFELRQVDSKTVWALESETSMAPVAPANTDTLVVAIDSDGFSIADPTVSGPSVAIEATNSSDVDHEVLVLRLGPSVSTDDLLAAGPSLPEGVTYIGQATVPAGGGGTLLLSGLQPGTYTIVDLLLNAQGLPNLSDGMSITFEVE
jgi:hypothetical protein